MTLAITSASTGAGQCSEISANNTTTVWTLLMALSPVPTGTVTYQIGQSYCADHTHPTEKAHHDMGNGLDLSYLLTS